MSIVENPPVSTPTPTPTTVPKRRAAALPTTSQARYPRAIPSPGSAGTPGTRPTGTDILSPPHDRLLPSSAVVELIGAPWDMLEELDANRALYVGGREPATLYRLPSYLRLALLRVAAREALTGNSSHSPGIGSMISCAIRHGISILENQPDIVALTEIIAQFHIIESDDMLDIMELADWFMSFAVNLPDSSGGATCKINYCISEDIKAELSRFANTLNVKPAILTHLCLLISLIGQPGVSRELQDIMESGLVVFFKRVSRRRKWGCRLIEDIEGGGIGGVEDEGGYPGGWEE